MFTPTLRCECAQPAGDRLMRKWCIKRTFYLQKVKDLKVTLRILF